MEHRIRARERLVEGFSVADITVNLFDRETVQ
jgi:hypothetical protein